jgi:hypothetical protein
MAVTATFPNVRSVLTPHNGLMEAVELRNGERSVLLLRDTVLRAESTTSPCMRL